MCSIKISNYLVNYDYRYPAGMRKFVTRDNQDMTVKAECEKSAMVLVKNHVLRMHRRVLVIINSVRVVDHD